jgi:hypothetical protein
MITICPDFDLHVWWTIWVIEEPGTNTRTVPCSWEVCSKLLLFHKAKKVFHQAFYVVLGRYEIT